MARVAHVRGLPAILPVVALLGFGGAVALATATGVIDAVAGVTLVTGANVYVGMRMLANRLHGETPRLGRGLLAAAAVLLGLSGAAHYGVATSRAFDLGLVVVVCSLFGLAAISDTRRSIVHLATISAR
jgi:hypothetical protein